jgi:hypothetical protein
VFKLTKSYDVVNQVFNGTLTLMKIFHFTIMAGLLGGVHLELGLGFYKHELTIGLHRWSK